MRLDGLAWQWGALLGVLLAGGCILFGGQTGEDSAQTASGCAPTIPIDVSATSAWGFSGQQMLDLYEGTWIGSAETTSGSASAELVSSAQDDGFPVTLVITYQDGQVLEADCDPRLEVEVWVSLDLGDGWVTRGGTASLDGDLAEAALDVWLAPAGDGSVSPADLRLAFGPDGTVAGSVTVGGWWGKISASRSQ